MPRPDKGNAKCANNMRERERCLRLHDFSCASLEVLDCIVRLCPQLPKRLALYLHPVIVDSGSTAHLADSGGHSTSKTCPFIRARRLKCQVQAPRQSPRNPLQMQV
jgi:hypothetical protein